MNFVKQITYEMYLKNGKEKKIHTEESPAISREEWDKVYPKQIWIPSVEGADGAVEKSEAECARLCEESNEMMEIAKE